MAIDGRRLGPIIFFNDTAKSCNLASLVVLAYDHLLTLGLETELVWPSPWTLGKLIYFCTTYFAWIDSFILAFVGSAPMPSSLCTILYKISRWLLLWGYVIAALVMVYRTWAIWERSRKILIYLLIDLTLSLAVEVWLFERELKGIEFIHTPATIGVTCVLAEASGPRRFGLIRFFLVTIFESIVLGLTLYKGREHFRFSRSALAVTMYHDSLLYYFYIIAFSLLNMLLSMLPGHMGHGLYLRQIERVMYSVVTKRLLLNLRNSLSQDRSKWAPATSFNNMSTVEHDDQGLS